VTTASAVALAHGYRTALYVLTGLLVLAALVAAGFVRPRARPAEAPQVEEELEVMEAAA
jgi:hypothetical protein